MMKFVKLGLIAGMTLTVAACGGGDEDVVADYIADIKDGKYADEADCIAEAMTADVGTDKMKKWADKIKEDGKIGALDLSFLKNLGDAAKKCVE